GAHDLDRPSVRVHDALHEAEPEPAARHPGGEGLTPSIESLEDPALLAARDAGAAVADGEAHGLGPARLRRFRGDSDPAAGGGMAGGVLDEVLQRAAQGGPVADYGREIRRDMPLDIDARFRDRPRAGLERFVHETRDRDRLAHALPLAGVDPRELEDLLDHLGQAPP